MKNMVEARDSITQGPKPAARRLSNFLLDYRFQLKYTGMVVAVTAVVAGVLGFMVYQSSVEVSEMMGLRIASTPTLSPEEMTELLEGVPDASEILSSVIGGLLVLIGAIGFTGIIVTHRVVGPAYRIQRCLEEVGRGRLVVAGRIRKGDELQNVFVALEEMIASLRAAQQGEIDLLTDAIAQAKDAGVPDEACVAIVAVRDRMIAALDE